MKGISVIIACYNSARVLPFTLRHLQAQKNWEGIAWEVIVVDNASKDGTGALAEKVWKENPVVPLRCIVETKQGEAHARKAGILAAQYDILSVVDDDNRVGEDWIRTLHAYYENPEIGLIGCAGIGAFEAPPPSWFKDHEHAFAIGKLYEGDFTDITESGLVPGAGLSVRKKVYDHLYAQNWHPFLEGRVGNKQTAGADSEMCLITRRLGYKIYYSNQLSFRHFTTADRISWERLKKMTYGFGAADVFLLVYQIHYLESTGRSSLMTRLRKTWWFNYLGKKWAYVFNKADIKDPKKRELFEIRNRAFCETILQEKARFKAAFDYLENVKPLRS